MKKHLSHLVILGFYTFMALALTWPIAIHITTHIPGEATWAFDESTFIWNMWWFKHSILNLQQTPLISTYTFFPLDINLTTYTFNLFNAALALPIQLIFSLPLANNLALLFSYIASAYGMFLLSLYLLHKSNPIPKLPNHQIPYLAAFAAGAVYAFSASRMMYVALGHYNFVTIQWFPFYTLFLLKSLQHSTIKNIILAGLFATFCLYAELTYSVFLLFITIIIVINQWLSNRCINRDTPFTVSQSALIIPLLSIGLITFSLTTPFILSILSDFLNPAYNEPGWGEGLKLSADLVGLVTVTPLHFLSGLDWVTELREVIEGTSRFSDANTLFLGYGVLALALLGFITYRKVAKVWFWMVVTFTILSLGPLLTINGQNRFNLDGIDTTFPLPFTLLHYLPVLSANRVPNRFGIPLTMALAVLVSFGLVWLLTKLSPSTPHTPRPTPHIQHSTSHVPRPTSHVPHPTILITTTVLLIILLFDQFSVPLPLTEARIPDTYHQIGAEPDDFTLMQLPLGWRNSYGTLGAERTQLQYFQTAHQKPILGGNTSRNPAFKFDYYAQIPLFKAITEVELYRPVDESTMEQAHQQASDLMALYNIKYLVVHDPIPNRPPYEDTYFATQQLALDLIPHQPEPIYQSPGVKAYAVEQSPLPNPLTLDFGTPASLPYRGSGWSDNEQIFAATGNWAIEPETEIFFPVRGPGDRQLSLQITPFSYPAAPSQQVSLQLNGQPIGKVYSLREGWQAIEVTLPEAALQNGLNKLTLTFAHTAQPRQVLPANQAIGNTGWPTPVDIEVNSGNDFAFITVGFDTEASDASAHRRGVNIAVIEANSGEVLEVKGFDTAANEFEAAALAEFIDPIPANQIVVVASQGPDATAYFNENTFIVLQSLGLNTKALTPPFSAIGLKGAAPGTAAQANGAGTAYLRLGASPDARNLAAAVSAVTIKHNEAD